MTPEKLAEQAGLLIKVAGDQSSLPRDPAQLAAVFRTAAEACTQVHSHNMLLAAMAHSLSK